MVTTESIPDFRTHTQSLLAKYYNRLNILPYMPDLWTVSRDPLLQNRTLLIYRDMARDDAVEMALSLSIASMLQGFSIRPTGDTAEHKLASDYVAQQYDALPGGIMPRLFEQSMAAMFGFSVSEVSFGLAQAGEFRGWPTLSEMDYRQPYWIDFEIDGDHLIGFLQVDQFGNEVRRLPKEKALHLVCNKHIDRFRGQSMFRPAFEHYWAKQLFIKYRNIQAERMAGKATVKIRRDDRTTYSAEQLKDIAEIVLDDYQNATGFVLPQGLDFEVVTGEADPNLYNTLVDHCDKRIFRAAGIPWLVVEEGLRSGSWALGKIHQETMLTKRMFPKRALEDLHTLGPVAQLCRLAGISKSHWPKVSLTAATEEEKRGIVEIYNAALQAGSISKRPQDENFIRHNIGAPEIDERDNPEPAIQQARQFADASRWWERPLSEREARVNFAEIDTGLNRIIEETKRRSSGEWKRAIKGFEREVLSWVTAPDVTPRQILKKISDAELDLETFEGRLVDGGIEAYEFGQEQARKELALAGFRKVFVDDAVAAPANPYSLGNFLALLLARAFEVRRGYEQKALGAIAGTLANAYESGATVPEATARLAEVFGALEAGQLISPGTPGYDFSKPAVQTTTVRTMMSSAFEGGRADIYQRNRKFVKGIERSEVAEGRDYGRTGLRSHPLSQHVDGITIRLSDSRWRKFVGPMHFNDRGVSVPITKLDKEPTWSTDAEIERALEHQRELSPRFV